MCAESFMVPEIWLKSGAPKRSRFWERIQFARSVYTVVGSIYGFDIRFSEVTGLSGGGWVLGGWSVIVG